MTTGTTRSGQKITVYHNADAKTHEFTEDAQHMRHFHTSLGRLLDEADAERQSEEAKDQGHRAGL